ncbi:MAG: hypothetical protein MZV70_69785 [Desulfobacterales bacterium]|nr:hypothetical protein [Desulfobacterales bacterium]
MEGRGIRPVRLSRSFREAAVSAAAAPGGAAPQHRKTGIRPARSHEE